MIHHLLKWRQGGAVPGLLFVFILFAGIITIIYNSIAVQNLPPHLMDEDCSQCHLATEDISATNAHLLVSSQETLCKKCHQSLAKNSHPSGISAQQKVSPPFILDWKGELTCSSCHFIHGQKHNMNRSTETGKNYCLICHEENFFENMVDKGRSIIGLNHLDSANYSTYSSMDPYSVRCMECHDEQGDMHGVSVTQNIIKHGGYGSSHPIGQQYSTAEMKGGYKPKAFLNPLIQLPEGRVACISCHEAYKEKHGKLVIARTEKELCLECHDL